MLASLVRRGHKSQGVANIHWWRASLPSSISTGSVPGQLTPTFVYQTFCTLVALCEIINDFLHSFLNFSNLITFHLIAISKLFLTIQKTG